MKESKVKTCRYVRDDGFNMHDFYENVEAVSEYERIKSQNMKVCLR